MNEKIDLKFGNVTKKKIETKNHFISHMLEHIAWRTGLEIDLKWESDDWTKLGEDFGKKVLSLGKPKKRNGVAIGMIDDGVAEVKIHLGKNELQFSSTENVDLNFFLSSRCEQIDEGQPLMELLQGLAKGVRSKIHIVVCNFEDPHHTWEGIFRGVGIAMEKIFNLKKETSEPEEKIEKGGEGKEISVLEKSFYLSEVKRGTAETGVTVKIDFKKRGENKFKFNVDESIDTSNLDKLLGNLAQKAGFSLEVDFNSKVLSSSHVVLEDVGLVLGKALLEILKVRFEETGANGAGSSLKNADDFEKQNTRVGISVEGRKFLRIIGFKDDSKAMNRKLIIGKNVYGNLRSEDLDDFLDGLVGGLNASLVVNVKEIESAEKVWIEIFENIGTALSEVFQINTSRKGVPPGVKATLS